MLKKSFWMKFKELFKTQYYVAAKVEITETTIDNYHFKDTAIVPYFLGEMVDITNIQDVNKLVLITTMRDISNG